MRPAVLGILLSLAAAGGPGPLAAPDPGSPYPQLPAVFHAHADALKRIKRDMEPLLGRLEALIADYPRDPPFEELDSRRERLYKEIGPPHRDLMRLREDFTQTRNLVYIETAAKSLSALRKRQMPAETTVVAGHAFGVEMLYRDIMDFRGRVGGLIQTEVDLNAAAREQWLGRRARRRWIAGALAALALAAGGLFQTFRRGRPALPPARGGA